MDRNIMERSVMLVIDSIQVEASIGGELKGAIRGRFIGYSPEEITKRMESCKQGGFPVVLDGRQYQVDSLQSDGRFSMGRV